MPIPLQDGWLYGPVDSRRYGRSLGVNPLPLERKVCSLDCLYCQYGYTRAQESATRSELPSREDLALAFDREFARLADSGDNPDRITVAGNGEPTLHPDFAGISADLASARDRFFPGCAIGILSNSMHLGNDVVLAALEDCYDERAMKFEWGDASCFAALNQVAPRGFERVTEGLARLSSFVVQALFMTGPEGDNSTPEQVEMWLAHLAAFGADRIERVEIYTLDRPPQDGDRAREVPFSRLEEIAAAVRAADLPVELYGR